MKVFISGSISIKTLPQIAKDKLNKKMAFDANFGMMIWDGQSIGTKANIEEMYKNCQVHTFVVSIKYKSSADKSLYFPSPKLKPAEHTNPIFLQVSPIIERI